MAIISCPSCNKRVSDKAAACEHCGFLISGQDAASMAHNAQALKNKRLNKLIGSQMKAMLLFVVGIAVAFYEWSDESFMASVFEKTFMTPILLKYIGFVLMGVGLGWYIITRSRIFNLKRKA